MKEDILSKSDQFIGKVNSILQEFHFVNSQTLLQLINTYATAFYGSSVWNLRSKECEKLFTTWNVTVRKALNLDRRTHRHLIVPLSECLHLKSVLMSRFIRFYQQSLINSPKFTVRFLARLLEHDKRSVFGQNLSAIARVCGKADCQNVTPNEVKKSVSYASPPAECSWIAGLASELLSIRDSKLDVVGFSPEEINEMLTAVCTS